MDEVRERNKKRIAMVKDGFAKKKIIAGKGLQQDNLEKNYENLWCGVCHCMGEDTDL